MSRSDVGYRIALRFLIDDTAETNSLSRNGRSGRSLLHIRVFFFFFLLRRQKFTLQGRGLRGFRQILRIATTARLNVVRNEVVGREIAKLTPCTWLTRDELNKLEVASQRRLHQTRFGEGGGLVDNGFRDGVLNRASGNPGVEVKPRIQNGGRSMGNSRWRRKKKI